ncbi:hypothetical protein J6590_065934 [Homalodisca vitripennis]|nr:hypothetical protein J6590_065934 [Homalodisca vitripennis]
MSKRPGVLIRLALLTFLRSFMKLQSPQNNPCSSSCSRVLALSLKLALTGLALCNRHPPEKERVFLLPRLPGPTGFDFSRAVKKISSKDVSLLVVAVMGILVDLSNENQVIYSPQLTIQVNGFHKRTVKISSKDVSLLVVAVMGILVDLSNENQVIYSPQLTIQVNGFHERTVKVSSKDVTLLVVAVMAILVDLSNEIQVNGFHERAVKISSDDVTLLEVAAVGSAMPHN